MKKVLYGLLAATLAVSLLSACGSSNTADGSGTGQQASGGSSGASLEEQRKKTFIWAVPALPNGCDNEFQYTQQAQELERNCYDSPLQYETILDEESGFLIPNYNKVVPALAESWEKSEDGRTITLKFRKGVLSTEGNELTADDFIYKWERGFGVMGNTGTFGAMYQRVADMNDIKKVDDYTVEITTAEPNPIAETMLCHVVELVIDGKTFQENATKDDPWALNWASVNTAGHGPWKVIEYTPGQQVVLVRNENYWDKDTMPYFDKVIIKEIPEDSNRATMVLSGDIDAATSLTASQLEELEGKDGVKVMHYDGNRQFHMGFNHTVEEFKSPLVKQAMGFAMPYDEILDTVYLGRAKQSKSLIPSTYPGYTDRYWKYSTDYDKAKELLAEAGYPNGFKCKLTIENANPQSEQTALLIQSSFRQVGIDMEIEKIQIGDYYNKLSNKDFDSLYLFLDSAGTPDPGFVLALFAQSTSINNMGHYSDPEVDELVEKIMSTTDNEERMAIADRLQEITVWENPFSINIAETGYDLAIRSDIEGVKWDTIQQIHWKYLKRTE